ncbi:MAG: hypothetical protein MK358_08605 [Vicinamibacterales bacterium]|nr:hypothetical protein [Vicinamibacterales bacterium]
MPNRFLALVVLLVFAAPGVWLDSGPVAAPTQEASSAIPRTPDGHPDLTGVYDVATMTPVDRPTEYGDRLFLTDEEVAAMVRYEEQRNERDLEPLDPNRSAPPVGGDRSPTNSYLEGLFRLGGGTVGGYNLFWLSPGERPVTIDGRSRTSLVVDPVNGRVPPMKPEAQQRMAALLASRARPDAGESDAGGPSSQYDAADRRPLAERCILGFGSTSGPPTLPNYFYNNLKVIVQTRDWVMIYNEMVHDTRMIPIGGAHLPPHVKQWMGNSVGHWEGDTLVLDTIGFNGWTRLDTRGHPHSDALHLIETYERIDADHINYTITVDDPKTYTTPWTNEKVFTPFDGELMEYVCNENNRSLWEGRLKFWTPPWRDQPQ